MPLRSGSSRAAIGANIRAERKAGRPLAQSVAIAMRVAGKPKPTPRSKRRGR